MIARRALSEVEAGIPFPVNSFNRQLLFCTVRIETVGAKGKGSGTGFIYTASQDGNTVTPVLVTNKHVLDGFERCTIFFIQGDEGAPHLDKPAVGYSTSCNPGPWVGHPDPGIDVAVMPLGPVINDLIAASRRPFYRTIPPSACPPEDALGNLDVAEPVTFVGYPNNLYDGAHNTPIIRQGATATPIQLDWNGLPQFLIDASVFPGSSGSPVFTTLRTSYFSGDSIQLGASTPYFLGIVAAVYQRQATGETVLAASQPRVLYNDMIHLGIVYKWTSIEEAVDEMCRKYGLTRTRLNDAPESAAEISEEAHADEA